MSGLLDGSIAAGLQLFNSYLFIKWHGFYDLQQVYFVMVFVKCIFKPDVTISSCKNTFLTMT